MSCEEEVIEVSKDGEYEIPQTVQESLKTNKKTKLHSTQNHVLYRKDGVPFPKYFNYHNIKLL